MADNPNGLHRPNLHMSQVDELSQTKVSENLFKTPADETCDGPQPASDRHLIFDPAAETPFLPPRGRNLLQHPLAEDPFWSPMAHTLLDPSGCNPKYHSL